MSTSKIMALMGEMAVFVKVVDTGSFSEAARQLGTTPSATSRSVARLEQALGTRLLQRTTRKLRLSESGRAVYADCLDMVNAAESVLANSGRFHEEPQGLLRISAPKAVGRFVVHPHIAFPGSLSGNRRSIETRRSLRGSDRRSNGPGHSHHRPTTAGPDGATSARHQAPAVRDATLSRRTRHTSASARSKAA